MDSPKLPQVWPLRRAHADDTFDHRWGVGLIGASERKKHGLVSNQWKFQRYCTILGHILW